MKRVLALILTMVVGLGLLTACAPDQDTCDHNWIEWTVVTEATCTVDGSEKRTCSICKKEETRPILRRINGANGRLSSRQRMKRPD